jgi:glycosyltransferase involved in cell wall biosynthesis
MSAIDVTEIILSIITAFGCLGTYSIVRRFRFKPTEKQPTTDDKTPTVSVAIAARNEMHALAQCLEYVLASDYPKLEILVLDDSSNDDTSVIIKSFAHAGVRFVAGQPLPAGWIGKNHAYQTLAQEASGNVLLFLDVDTLLQPSSISQLVTEYVNSGSKMLSVLPRREDGERSSALFGSLRYFWDLILSGPRRPPVASAVFLIDNDTFVQSAKLPEFASAVQVERLLAASLPIEKYRYFIGTKELGVRYEKHWLSQAETAGRLYYQFVGKNMIGFLAACVLLVIFITAGLMPKWSLDIIARPVSRACFLIVTLTFVHYNFQTIGGNWFNVVIRSVMWPLLLLQELVLLITSFMRYQLKTVTWKGRPLAQQPSNRNHLELNE